jgi:hypothetical protein
LYHIENTLVASTVNSTAFLLLNGSETNQCVKMPWRIENREPDMSAVLKWTAKQAGNGAKSSILL